MARSAPRPNQCNPSVGMPRADIHPMLWPDVTNGRYERVKLLLEAVSDVNSSQHFGYLVHAAASGGHDDVMRLLHNAVTDFSAVASSNGSGVVRAAASGG